MPETQSQRWLKYGVNVAVSSVVVIALAVVLVWIAQRHPARIDTTFGGVYTLKPQTKAVVSDLNQSVRLVSLYPNPVTVGKEGKALQDAENDRRYAGAVSDLLQEYAKASPKVTVEYIDPERESTKLDKLVDDVMVKYGKELEPYKAFLANYQQFIEKFKTFADTENKSAAGLSELERTADESLYQTLVTLRATVTQLPQKLEQARDDLKQYTDRKFPDYRAAADSVRTNLQVLDALLGSLEGDLGNLPKTAPEAVRKYAEESKGRYEAAHKLVKDQLEAEGKLPELKLDSLRKAIGRSTILVMGDKDMKVLNFNDVWGIPDDVKSMGTQKEKRRKFAGERQVTGALVSIENPKKQRVIFVRPGGAPLTQSLFREAPFGIVARRLRAANCEVLEKDLSGQFAMQAQMQGMPVQEATDEQMADRSAVWVCFALAPAMGQTGPDPMPGKLTQHLEEGGSALLLVEAGRDDCQGATKPFGITPRTDMLVVKETRSVANTGNSDMVTDAQRRPFIFTLTNYGVGPLAKPMGGLQSLLLPLSPVMASSEAGVTTTPLLPIPSELRSWGESSVDDVLEGNAPEFDAGKDLENTSSHPMYAGAMAEKILPAATQPASTQPTAKPRNTRLVVLGTATSFSNSIVSLMDEQADDRGIPTARFPGNAELFVNSVLWCAGNDTMLAISPAAMEVSRIPQLSPGQIRGVQATVLIGLPALVLIAGAFVWASRRS
jgi:hypothetical protein